MNRRSLERFRELQLRRRTDDAPFEIRDFLRAFPIIDRLHTEMTKRAADPRSLLQEIIFREDFVLRKLITSLAPHNSTSLMIALRYLCDEMVDPKEITAYMMRHDGKFRGNFRIKRNNGSRIMSPHDEDLVIERDELVQWALEHDSVYCVHDDTLLSRKRGSGIQVKTKKLPVPTALSRMVIPLKDAGLVDIKGKDLTFGFFSTMPRVVDFASYLSIILATKIMAEIDPLTGLFTRRVFYQSLSEAAREYRETGKKFSLLAGDIDFFKQVNDTHGHPSGDCVLVGVASRAQEVFRATDHLSRKKEIDGEKKDEEARREMLARMGEGILARPGGEEFAFLLPGTDLLGAIRAAKRYCDAIRSTTMMGAENQGIDITMSFGVASIDEAVEAIESRTGIGSFDPDSTEDKLRCLVIEALADKALYMVKENGRDGIASVEAIEPGRIIFKIENQSDSYTDYLLVDK